MPQRLSMALAPGSRGNPLQIGIPTRTYLCGNLDERVRKRDTLARAYAGDILIFGLGAVLAIGKDNGLDAHRSQRRLLHALAALKDLAVHHRPTNANGGGLQKH